MSACRFQYAGSIALLCDCYADVVDSELKEMIIQAVEDWCELSGWTYTFNNLSITIQPPKAGE